MVEAASRRFPVHLAVQPPGTRQDIMLGVSFLTTTEWSDPRVLCANL